jgi:lipoprotein-releasing system permease protein
MNFSYYIAKRHLLGHHKIGFISFISIFSVIGLSVGVAALILTVSILNGFEKELKSKLVDFDSHIRLSLMYSSSIDSIESVAETLNDIPEIKHIVPYIQRSVIIRNKNLTDGVFVEGLDQEQLGNTINIKRFLVEGEVAFQTKEGKDGILMGQKLARKLELELGDKVYLFVIRGDNHIGSRPKIGTFILTGIYDSGVSDYDDIFVYSSLEAVRKLFRASQSLSGFQIMLHNPEKADEIASLIDEKLGFPYNARSMNDMHANLFEWLRVQRLPVILIFGLISLVAVFNIVSSLMMIVIEKTKDIGILKSYGVNNLQIMRIFVLESLFIGLAGVGIGFLLTLLLSWLQNNFGLISIPEDVYFMHELPILLDVKNFIYVGVGALFFSLTATVYPAYKATQLEPVEAIRYE